MKKILSTTFVLLFLILTDVQAQNKDIPADAVVVNVLLTDETAQQAKKLKTLESGTLFKGVSRNEFQCYLNEDSSIEALQNEVAELIPGAKAVIRKK